ncbi:MAG: hypothetical protein ABIU63_09450 [Chitinophagaceae bacterium]
MANEKQTDGLHWVNKLDQLDSLPGASMPDKNSSWERLHGRLHEKRRRKNHGWYWAAACFLLLSAWPLLVKIKKQPVSLQNLVEQRQVPIQSIPAIVINPDMMPVITSKPPAKKEMAYHSLKHTPNPIEKNKIDPGEGMIAADSKADSTTTTMSGHGPDTAVALVAAMPAKKRLPVVHINELGKQEQENAKFASRTQWPAFQIRFLNQENNSGTSTAPVHTASDILQIKIPLKN